MRQVISAKNAHPALLYGRMPAPVVGRGLEGWSTPSMLTLWSGTRCSVLAKSEHQRGGSADALLQMAQRNQDAAAAEGLATRCAEHDCDECCGCRKRRWGCEEACGLITLQKYLLALTL